MSKERKTNKDYCRIQCKLVLATFQKVERAEEKMKKMYF